MDEYEGKKENWVDMIYRLVAKERHTCFTDGTITNDDTLNVL